MSGHAIARRFLGALVRVVVDRPLGSHHPRGGWRYPVNYGLIRGVLSGDGEELDAYILGVDHPLAEFEGRCVAALHRLDDDDDKLIVVPDGLTVTDEQIRLLTWFQERFFRSEIWRPMRGEGDAALGRRVPENGVRMRQFKTTPVELIADELSVRLGRPVSLRRIGGYLGRSEVFAMDATPSVVKVFHHHGADKCAREAAALRALTGRDIPVPTLLDQGIFDDGEPWLLMEQLPGKPLDASVSIPPAVARDLFASMGGLLASVHLAVLDPDASTALQRKRPELRYAALRKQVLDAGLPERDLFEKSAERMAALELRVGPTPDVCLIHRDFNRRNVLLTLDGATEWRITGLIDFERAQIGDNMEDLARVAFAEFIGRPEQERAFLDAYGRRVPMPEHMSERLLYHLYGFIFEIASWSHADDPPYYRRAVEALAQMEQGTLQLQVLSGTDNGGHRR